MISISVYADIDLYSFQVILSLRVAELCFPCTLHLLTGFGNLDRIYSISNSFPTPLLDPGSRMEAWWGLKSFKKDLFLLGLDPWRPIRKLFTFFKITCEGIVLELRNVISANINMHIAVIFSPKWSLYDLHSSSYTQRIKWKSGRGRKWIWSPEKLGTQSKKFPSTRSCIRYISHL